MSDFIARQAARPAIAHLLRAARRFSARLGDQFGAALTYYSVLTLVPVLMFAFAILGFLSEAQPALINPLINSVSATVSGREDAPLAIFIAETLRNWRGVSVVALITALYSGSAWIANLKRALREQWRSGHDPVPPSRNVVVETLINAGLLIALLVVILVTFAVASIGTIAADDVIAFLAWDQVPAIGVLASVASIAVSLLAGTGLFLFLYGVLPQTSFPWRPRVRGALAASVGLGVLQYGATLLVGVFSSNRAFLVFGPIIVVMLFFNLFARMTLFIAAWIATWHPDGTATRRLTGAAPGEVSGDTDRRAPSAAPDPVAARAGGDPRRAAAESARPVDGAVAWRPGEGREVVSQDVAARSVRAGIGAGWVVGAATGIGLGAALTWLASILPRRR